MVVLDRVKAVFSKGGYVNNVHMDKPTDKFLWIHRDNDLYMLNFNKNEITLVSYQDKESIIARHAG